MRIEGEGMGEGTRGGLTAVFLNRLLGISASFAHKILYTDFIHIIRIIPKRTNINSQFYTANGINHIF